MPVELPLRLSSASGLPFYRQVVDQVSALVRSGALAPGQQLPSVRELAGSLLVSVITIRRAYAELEAAGLIERRQGTGTFVAEDVATANKRRSRQEAYEALESAVARARQLGLDDEEIRTFLTMHLDRPSSRPWRL